MFGSIGMTELIVILVVALVVIGPKRLPELARTLGKALGDFKRATSDFQDSFSMEDDYDLLDEDEKRKETQGEKSGEDAAERGAAPAEADGSEAGEGAAGSEAAPGQTEAAREDGEKT